VSQLKAIQSRSVPKSCETPIESVGKADTNIAADQDHYLEDFMFAEEEEDGAENIIVHNANAQEVVEVPGPVGEQGVHIDNAYVDIDRRNIIPQRTRGVRRDYALLDGGEVV
jgi:hypothetical protein